MMMMMMMTMMNRTLRTMVTKESSFGEHAPKPQTLTTTQATQGGCLGKIKKNPSSEHSVAEIIHAN